MKPHDRISYLLRQYRNGTHTEQELDELLRFAARETNSGLLEAEITEFLQTPLPESKQAEVLALADAIRERLLHRTQPRPVTRHLWTRVAGVAVLLCMVTLGALFLQNRLGSKTSIKTTADIPAGGHRATLTLADGRVIDLSTEQTGIISTGENIRYSDGSTPIALLDDLETSATPKTLTLTTPKGGTYQVTLPDGSRVWLNAGSTLSYPSHFNGKSRTVEIRGEAYFSVTKDASKPFRVRSQGQVVEVLGTQFNISAYPDEAETQTTLVEGRVRLLSDIAQSVILAPNQQASLRGTTITVNDVDTSPYTAWKDGYFKFKKQPITEIMKQLARWYDVEVHYEGPIQDIRYSGRIARKENISAVLHIMEMTDAVQFEIQENERRIIVKH